MNRSEGQWTQPELSGEVHRGFKTTPEPEMGLGPHWSDKKGIAKFFATYGGGSVHPDSGAAIVHARVPVSSVETDSDVLSAKAVYPMGTGGYKREREVPVKEGAPVQVTGITKLGNTRDRTRTYNPPREMKA